MAVPFVSVGAVLLALPLVTMDAFSVTNENVEWVFMSLVVKSTFARLVFISYFSVLWFAFLSFIAFFPRKSKREKLL